MPERGVEGFEVSGSLALPSVFPYQSESRSKEEDFEKVGLALESQSFCDVAEVVAWIQLVEVHPFCHAQIDSEYFQNLVVCDSIGVPSCDNPPQIVASDAVADGADSEFLFFIFHFS